MLPLLVAFVAAAEPTVTASTSSVPYLAVFAKGEDSTAERNAGRLEFDLSQALAKRGAAMADLEARFPPPIEPSDEGDKLIAAGKDAYDNLDLDGAVAKLTDGALFFVKHPTVASPKKMAEVFVFLGAAGLQNRNKQASKEFARAAVLDPDYVPDSKFFGADVQKAFIAAKAEVAARKKSAVLFESAPTGSTVELNGKAIGVTPLTAVELAAGRYHVRMTHPGYVPAAKFPEVEAGADLDVKLDLNPLPTYGAQLDLARKLIGRAGFDTQKLPPQATQLGTALQARYLVLISTKTVRGISTECEAQVWDTQTGDRLRELKFQGDAESLDRTAEVMKRWIDRPSPVTVVEAQPSSGSGVFKQPWFIIAAGVVVAGAAAGIAVGVTRTSHHYDHLLDLP